MEERRPVGKIEGTTCPGGQGGGSWARVPEVRRDQGLQGRSRPRKHRILERGNETAKQEPVSLTVA